MHKYFLGMALVFAAGVFSGCETVKSTVSGPFIGMKKDAENYRNVIREMRPMEKIKKMDEWMQKNMW